LWPLSSKISTLILSLIFVPPSLPPYLPNYLPARLPTTYNPCGFGFLGRGISLSEGRYTHGLTQTQFKRSRTFMPRVRFEPTIPEFKRTKAFCCHCDRLIIPYTRKCVQLEKW
jgi:hypothetical protein